MANSEFAALGPQAQRQVADVLGRLERREIEEIEAWRELCADVLRPEQPYELHARLHRAVFARWDAGARGPPPVWAPAPDGALDTNAARFMARFHGDAVWDARRRTGSPATDWPLLQRVSCDNPEVFWAAALRGALALRFDTPPTRMIEDDPGAPDGVRWLPGARLNIAAAALRCPRAPPDAPAIVWADEGSPTTLVRVSRDELAARAARVAAAVSARFPPGSALAINMPMTADAVAIYLGIILAGCAVVSIADSFAPAEVASRLRIACASAIFTQDVLRRGGKALPLYARVVETQGAPPAIVLPSIAGATTPSLPLRPGDVSFDAFLAAGDRFRAAAGTNASDFEPLVCDAYGVTNVLFSSGTTGEPKAIPWTHVTPLRCAVDAWAHQDVRPGDVVAWPTNLGWMMGPWLVYAALLNGATIALYNGSPLERGFGEYVAAARVTMLGLVPSIARAWRASGCMRHLDWRALRCFSSSGEASSPDDYAWLSARVPGYRPVIEYCGGTELGGGFLSGSLLAPQAPGAFSTPTLGAQLVLLGSGGEQSEHAPGAPPFVGELALRPPLLGSSQALLNRDHAATYFEGMPAAARGRDGAGGVDALGAAGFAASVSSNGGSTTAPPLPLRARAEGTPRPLRRHGDEVARLAGGYYRVLGRCDDTMNLGGIKVASVELEQAVAAHVPSVAEAAAVGVPAPGGGPERLHVFVVLKSGGAGGGGISDAELLAQCQAAVRTHLNPLFKVERVAVVPSLPRTASQKVMRRVLRDRRVAGGGSDAGAGGGAPRAKM